MTRGGLPLRVQATGWVLLAFLCGAVAAVLWTGSTARWEAWQAQADRTGALIYAALVHGADAPPGVTIAPLPAGPETADEAVRLDQQTGAAPRPARITLLSILGTAGTGLAPAAPLSLAILSPDIAYPLSRLGPPGDTPADRMGAVSALMASYCSEPLLYARVGQGNWQRIAAPGVWGCAAAPRDTRLFAVALAILGLALLLARVGAATAGFAAFARWMRTRRRGALPEDYDVAGPAELQEIVSAVNASLESERMQLAQRATVLSGVSHDLGTPAARLRLRAALIEDAALRAKFDADIDQMTGMIESVLTYTRSELNAEPLRRISLTALVHSVIDDFEDMGQPVHMADMAPVVATGGQTLFAARRGHAHVPEGKLILSARPISLQRAIANLIDNALKYGRRATVSLETGPDTATIVVEDEGGGLSPDDLAALQAPFQRGANSAAVAGTGLGLTIVATVADQHNGSLRFEEGRRGLRACLTIRRD